MKTVKLSELGNTLPIGSLANGGGPNTFTFKPLTLGLEKELAKKAKKLKTSHKAGQATALLSLSSETIGSKEYATGQYEEVRKDISSMFFSDVLYMYVYLRYQNIDPIVKFNVNCLACGASNKMNVDLGQLDIKVPEEQGELHGDYLLSHPVKHHKLGEIKSVGLRPVSWSAIQKGGDTIPAMKELFVLASVFEMNGEPGYFTKLETEQMSKKDVDIIVQMITDLNCGPELDIEGDCVSCEAPFKRLFDWDYDSFFVSSSQSTT